ncbi:MAG: hypothetical protein CM15mV41_0160 [Caudoviricetes sp.]|nr:MAG: hypothetical protein CM15mV41_0160 [Caudoviricetes sp.]
MPYIENIAKKECGVSVKGSLESYGYCVSQKNSKRVVEGTIKEITNIDGMSKDAKLTLLNAYIVRH